MNKQKGVTEIVALTVLVVVVIVGLMWGWPVYRVWQQGLEGEATLRRAEQERQVQVKQAEAEVDSAKLVAEAIAIVGQAAKDYPEYRQQMFISGFAEALKEGSIDQIFYIPTEGMIPIMEAGRATR